MASLYWNSLPGPASALVNVIYGFPIFKWVAVTWFNTLRLRQNGRHFPDDIFKCISLNENLWILIEISLNFVPRGPINNIPALVQIMAWRRPGDKPLSEPMMVCLLTHICVTQPQYNEIMIGHQESSPSNDYQGGMSHFIQMPMSWNPN